jgi:translocation and assembly module TamA
VIRELRIEGARQVSETEIRQKILTAPTSKLPFTRKRTFDRNVWKTDLRRIERYYQERGFYQARVVKEEAVPDGKGGVSVQVQVDEGSPTLISELEVEGLEALPEARCSWSPVGKDCPARSSPCSANTVTPKHR